jgi:glycosyltransferase involved in cell wall biosynthesis
VRLHALHQFHPTIAYGDAISNDCFELQRLFWSAGMFSDIYAADTKEELRPFTRPTHELDAAVRKDGALLIHHSMGNESVAAVANRAFPRKAVVYHNITPASYFEGISDWNRDHARQGREQLVSLAHTCELGIADSEFNRQELEQSGFSRTAVVPILVDWASYDVAPDPGVLRALADERTAVLVVGQILPQKANNEVLPAFARYRARDRAARLYLIGSTNMSGSYLGQLMDSVRELGLEGAVTFTGRVSLRALVAYYQAASVVLTLSDHEGFCVPLLEAMRFERPIVAHAAGAIPETLGDAGILLEDKTPDAVADALERAVRDAEVRRVLVAKGRARLADFSRDKVAKRLHDVLKRARWDLPKSRPRTIAVISSAERCGIHHYSKAVCDGLRADGHEVSFIGIERGNTGDLFRKIDRLPLRIDAVLIEHEAGIFREIPFVRALFALRERGLPTILSLHEFEPEKFHSYRMLIQALGYRPNRAWPLEVIRVPYVALVVAWRFTKYRTTVALTGLLPSRLVVHSARSKFWSDLLTTDRSKVQDMPLVAMPLEDTVLPKDAEEKRALRRRLGLPEDAFIFVSPGFFFRRKRFLEVISATPESSVLVFSGTAAAWEQDYFDEVTEFVRLRSQKNVVVNTDYETMGEHVAAADCVVLFYEDIFQSAVAAQAVWAGLPCIFADIPGFALYKGAGLFVRDSHGLAQAMVEVQAPETYARLCEQVAVLRHRLAPERLAPRYLSGLPPQ